MEPPNLQQILVLLPKYVYLKSHKSFMSFLAIQLHHSPSQNMNTTIYVVGPYSKSTGTFSLLLSFVIFWLLTEELVLGPIKTKRDGWGEFCLIITRPVHHLHHTSYQDKYQRRFFLWKDLRICIFSLPYIFLRLKQRDLLRNQLNAVSSLTKMAIRCWTE